MKNFFSSRLSRYMLASTAALALLSAGSQSCLANSITLTSSSNGVYDYGLTVTNLLDVFDKGQTISLSGLSGVTGASVAGVLAADGFKVSSFTSTSVVYAETLPVALLPGPFTWGSLVVDSSMVTQGTIDFGMQTANNGTISGTTRGPVATVATTEAGSTLLYLGIMLAILLVGSRYLGMRSGLVA
jgi:hypothetical protein